MTRPDVEDATDASRTAVTERRDAVRAAERANARAALERFAVRRRRLWLRYGLAMVVVIALTVAGVLVAWYTGDAAQAHLKTATRSVAAIPRTTTSTPLTAAWNTGDRLAIGQPVLGGIVVTYSAHTVSARDGRDGSVVWSYKRDNATVCQVAQEQGKTVALYARDNGDCNQISAFYTTTGQRAWERTLDEKMTPLLGHPSTLALSDTFFAWNQQQIFAISVDSYKCVPERGADCGYDRWQYIAPAGCTIAHFVPGSIGALISLHCVDGDQLLLRDRYANTDDDNPTRIFWTLRPSTLVPVAADFFVGAVDPATGKLTLLNKNNGAVLSTRTLSPAPRLPGSIEQTLLPQSELVRIGAVVYQFDLTGGGPIWARSLVGMPTWDFKDGTMLYLPSGQGVQVLSGVTGASTRTLSGPDTTGATQLIPLGSGFVVAGPRGTTVLK